MKSTRPLADAVPAHEQGDVIARTRRLIVERGRGFLANNTKWNRLITAMRERDGWKPSYRCKCIDAPPSGWDVEWWYHLPFPFITVEWLDIQFHQETRCGRFVAAEITDHSGWIGTLLNEIGFDYRRGKGFFRVFGYSPRNMDRFEE